MSWLEKILPKSKITTPRRHNIPEGVWTKCTACEQVLYRAELERNLEVCPKCDHHMRISARARLESFLDAEGRSEVAAELEPQDILKFKDSRRYKDRLSAAQKETGEKDALVAKLPHRPLLILARPWPIRSWFSFHCSLERWLSTLALEAVSRKLTRVTTITGTTRVPIGTGIFGPRSGGCSTQTAAPPASAASGGLRRCKSSR